MSQSIEVPVSSDDRLILGGRLDVGRGRGAYALSLGWRRLVSQFMWAEVIKSTLLILYLLYYYYFICSIKQAIGLFFICF